MPAFSRTRSTLNIGVRRRWSLLATFALAILLSGPAPCQAGDIREATLLFRQGKYAECVDSAAQGIVQNPFSEPLRLIKIRAEMEQGKYPLALQSFDTAIERFSQSVQMRWLGRDVCRFNGQPERADRLDAEIMDLVRRIPWRYGDVATQLAVGQWMIVQQTDPKKVLDQIYNEVKRLQPTYVDTYLVSGRLALGKHDYQLAGEAFTQAVKLDPENADAHYGLACAFAQSNAETAQTAITTALKHNPRHVDSLLFVADNQIDSERYREADETLAQVAAVNPQHPRALAYRAILAHLRNEKEAEQQQRTAALKHWATNPEVDFLIGQKLSQKYRFAEGARYQRLALAFDPNYLPAKEQLAQDLMRLGREEEGWQLAESVYEADGYNVLAHNLVTLQENLSKFRTLESDGFMVRMEAREADIYGARVLALLRRAKTTLAAKYATELPTPIIVEIFPHQEDFAIRTFGMPGGAGFLGVCFGTVITANSPASQGTHPSCWESTLWHEFCHVVTLNKTNNMMPRWLSEGISVYEERQADPAWGQRITPHYREMILGEDLTPVSKLSGAFLHPASPQHLMFAYFESSLVVEYLVQKYGQATLQRVLVDLGAGMPINDSLARYTGSIDALDQEFAKYAREQAQAMAPKADWTTVEWPRRPSLDAIKAVLEEHPDHYVALRRLAEQHMAQKQWEAAKAPLERMLVLFPSDGEAGNAYKLLARVHRELGEQKQERAALEKLANLSDDDVDSFARLGEITAASGDWEQAKRYALRTLAVDPLLPEPHRRAVLAAEHLKNFALVVDSGQALLLLDPVDPADIHFRMGHALQQSGDLAQARRHALLALEETPRYRDAQRLLLEIVQSSSDNEAKDAKPLPGGPAVKKPESRVPGL